jgi:hypothetical protein
VGSLRFGSIRFVVYSNDHLPRHVHAFYQGTEIIVDLTADNRAAVADRDTAISPRNAKRSTVKKVLIAAAEHFDELVTLWEVTHAAAEQ